MSNIDRFMLAFVLGMILCMLALISTQLNEIIDMQDVCADDACTEGEYYV